MSKNKLFQEKDKPEFLKLPISIEELKKRLTASFWSIKYDFEVIHSIEVLQMYSSGTHKVCQIARTILNKELGLRAAIPKEALVRHKSKSSKFRWYKERPAMFIREVEAVKKLISPDFSTKAGKRKYYKRDDRPGKTKQIKETFKSIFNKDLTDDSNLTDDSDITHIALLFISGFYNIPFITLFDFYYRNKSVQIAKKEIKKIKTLTDLTKSERDLLNELKKQPAFNFEDKDYQKYVSKICEPEALKLLAKRQKNQK